MIKITSPVLLIAFNRPENTKIVFEKIKQAKPSKLYLAVDAPRENNDEDQIRVHNVQKIFDQINWECDVNKRYATKNQGCGIGVFNAISWIFEHEDRAIILEDDCVPSIPFFSYCDDLLDKYKNDTRIWLISGNNFNEEAVSTQHSYFFSRFGHSWGWATWKRCWDEMDLHILKYPLIRDQDLLKAAFASKKETDFYNKYFNRVYNDKCYFKNNWDIQFSFTIHSNGGLTIIPRKNLVSNIGSTGTHTISKAKFHNLAIDNDFKIMSHPDFILPDVNYDTYHFRHHIHNRSNLLIRIYKKARLILRGLKK